MSAAACWEEADEIGQVPGRLNLLRDAGVLSLLSDLVVEGMKFQAQLARTSQIPNGRIGSEVVPILVVRSRPDVVLGECGDLRSSVHSCSLETAIPIAVRP